MLRSGTPFTGTTSDGLMALFAMLLSPRVGSTLPLRLILGNAPSPMVLTGMFTNELAPAARVPVKVHCIGVVPVETMVAGQAQGAVATALVAIPAGMLRSTL